MDGKKERKGRILWKLWIQRKEERKNIKESMDSKKGRKRRILRMVQIERRKDGKEEY